MKKSEIMKISKTLLGVTIANAIQLNDSQFFESEFAKEIFRSYSVNPDNLQENGFEFIRSVK